MWFWTWAGPALLAASLPAWCSAEQIRSETSLISPAELLAQVPLCAAKCLTTIVSNSTCPLTDMHCICASKEIDSRATDCILATCQLVDALAAKNATATACHAPIRDKSGVYSAMSIALGAVTVALVLARMCFKRFFSATQSLGPDDKVILGTLALRIACTIINVKGLAAHGLGKDAWIFTPDELTTFVELIYVMEVLYFAELSLIKLSLSLFYVYIFPGVIVKRLLWGTVIFNLLFGIVFVVAAIFECNPISYYWTQYVQDATGHCVNINGLAWANAGISVAVDFWMIAIPLSQIPKLKLHWKKKIGVTIMFLLGAFVNIVSVLRLRSLISFANSTNPTWDQWDVVLWSTIEVNVGMICTCLPSVRLILLRIFPKFLSTGTIHTNSSNLHSENQTGRSQSSPGADYALSGIDVSKGHTWTRIESESKL